MNARQDCQVRMHNQVFEVQQSALHLSSNVWPRSRQVRRKDGTQDERQMATI